MNDDARLPYRDPLDADPDVHTDLVTDESTVNTVTEVARLTDAVNTTGKALLDAVDALIRSPLPDPLDSAALVARLTTAIDQRQAQAITKLVVDGKVPTRQVADRLGWTMARVAFACKAKR